ncbi:MAG: phosphonate metabolism protein/1,5-bisphosphokinase (PRPP-forming) PhnN [Pseudorhodoplanes sp.]
MSAERIGPGRLVLVVGPSGGGKDTLITGTKTACSGDPAIVFPRRIVTRPVSGFEDHDSLSETEFARAEKKGGFAFSWDAHGLKYGIPRAIDDDLREGRIVVCNVSRSVIPYLRSRYAETLVVLVTAPEDVLAARLRARQRVSDGSTDERIKRSEKFPDFVADHRIENVDDVATGVSALCEIVRAK